MIVTLSPFSTSLLIIVLVIAGCSENGERVFVSPVEPENVLQTMEIADGFSIELFVSEPLVTDPVAMEIDEYGRMYVVEMPGYPLDTEGSGRIKILSDTNGDGYPDESAIFAEGLVLPKGIMRWKKGILVTDAPHLYYLEDSTGDGRADIKEIVISGFARSNPQHNFNTPRYGLDNWIYLANSGTIGTETYADKFGGRGSEIHFPENSNSIRLPQNADGRNVRLKPGTYELEMLSTWSQFGHDFDAWGRHLLVSNAHHLFHEAIPARYAGRNPDLSLRSAVHHMPVHGDAAEVFPITRNPEHQLLTDIGVMTSACAVTCYLGGAFGDEFRNVTFIAEPVHNIVHADKITENNTAFEAHRLIGDREFLASTDGWFRPVNFYIGPDGALYIIDYYRQIIEHPQWMDDVTVETSDLYSGIDRGRIYRVVPENAPGPDWLSNINLGNLTPENWVDELESDNIWWRRNAQRLLVGLGGMNVAEALHRLVTQSRLPEARLHALWSLEGLLALDTGVIRSALQDEEAGIRENAIKLAELYMDDEPELLADLLLMENDESARVRYQLLLTLGFVDEPEVREARQRILFRDIEDHWVQIAALSSPFSRDENLLGQAITELSDIESPGRENYFRQAGAMVAGGRNTTDIRDFVRETVEGLSQESLWWRSAALSGLADRIHEVNLEPGALAEEYDMLFSAFFESDKAEFRRSILMMMEAVGLPDGTIGRGVLQRAESAAKNPRSDGEFRADAIRLLGLVDARSYEEMLRDRIDPSEPAMVQRAALKVLRDMPGNEVGEFVLSRWSEMTPEVRDEAINVLMTDRDRVEMLLDAIEQGTVLVSTLGWGRRVVLMRDWSGDVRERARELLSENPSERREVLEHYTEVFELHGDAGRGRQVFADNCSQCHQMRGGEGTSFGPDLGTVRHWTPQALMAKILDPNRSIADGYEMWLVERESGGTLSGAIVTESPQAVTLRNAGGIETTISRSDIESISSANVSAMPGGMEQQINIQQMADLIEFIRRGR